MKYLLLIYEAEKTWASLPKEEQGRVFNEYMSLTQELAKSGQMMACEPLEPTSTATTLRVRDGKATSVDGPFAETKEQLGGVYVIDVKNLDEAMAWAAKIPGARTGSIEIRPVMKFD
ncbi:MAG: YciI family protein [Deltaproteobacteria bacterium]